MDHLFQIGKRKYPKLLNFLKVFVMLLPKIYSGDSLNLTAIAGLLQDKKGYHHSPPQQTLQRT